MELGDGLDDQRLPFELVGPELPRTARRCFGRNRPKQRIPSQRTWSPSRTIWIDSLGASGDLVHVNVLPRIDEGGGVPQR